MLEAFFLALRACDLCLPNHRLIHLSGLRNPDTERVNYPFRYKVCGNPESVVQQEEQALGREVSRTNLGWIKPRSSAYTQQIEEHAKRFMARTDNERLTV